MAHHPPLSVRSLLRQPWARPLLPLMAAAFLVLALALALLVPTPAAAQGHCDWTPTWPEDLDAPMPPDRTTFYLRVPRDCVPAQVAMVLPDGTKLDGQAVLQDDDESGTIPVLLRFWRTVPLEPDTVHTIEWIWLDRELWEEGREDVEDGVPARPYRFTTGEPRDPTEVLSLDDLTIERFEASADRDLVFFEGTWSDPTSLGYLRFRTPRGRRPGSHGGSDFDAWHFYAFPAVDGPELRLEVPSMPLAGGRQCAYVTAGFDSAFAQRTQGEAVCFCQGCATGSAMPSLGALGLVALVVATRRRRSRRAAQANNGRV